MPRYYEDKPEGGACAGVKEDLGACLLQSDCVLQVARPGAPGGDHARSQVAGLGQGPPARDGGRVQGVGHTSSCRAWADPLSCQSLSSPPVFSGR